MVSVHLRFGSPRPSGERGLGGGGQARSIDFRTAREELCPMREDRHTLSQRENPPQLLRGSAESHISQDLPSFATKTS